MIVLASDEVGLRIVQLLARDKRPIGCLVLDPADRGGYNQAIAMAYQTAFPNGLLEQAPALQHASVLDRLAGLRPRLGVLAWWPSIIKGRLLEIPTLGWLNLHPGFLPFNRGKHPNFWCLVDGTPCGAALHLIDPEVDTGPLVVRGQVEVGWGDTGETIHKKCRQLAVELFAANIDRILSGDLRPVPQDESIATSHRASEIDVASAIALDEPTTARRLLNVIRARMFPPHPMATFRDQGRTYSVQVLINEVKEP